ncbi:MAG: hypothetical protein PVH88_23495 [Ignavibacteria bacterium]|jgi:hypothetical protein
MNDEKKSNHSLVEDNVKKEWSKPEFDYIEISENTKGSSQGSGDGPLLS